MIYETCSVNKCYINMKILGSNENPIKEYKENREFPHLHLIKL